MKTKTILVLLLLCAGYGYAQDLSVGLSVINDTGNYPMQPKAKPAYLDTIIDPSFGTTIRRISNAPAGGIIVPMYSTVQAWNADESLMIVYEQGTGHRLLDGMSYQFIRYLSDLQPDDLEQIFWDFNDPAILYYLESGSDDFIRYNVNTQNKQILVNLDDLVTNCTGSISMGNDVQMMSWDSDVISFRCNNDRAYYYRISTGVVREFNLSNVSYTAPMPGPSGNLFYHRTDVYNANGNLSAELNENSTEHSCLGKLANGDDAHFAIAFAQGPEGGCIGDIIAHNMVTGACFPVISQSQGYNYPQSGTHISALAHKNTQSGWMAASMMGYELDGSTLLDQELVIARAEEGNVKVCRIGHHRSDENEYNYWGEPHAVISPTGTRVLFGSDWSGAEDGQSVDCYVVELPSFTNNPPVAEIGLDICVLLEGSYDPATGLMSNTLETLNLLSPTQPYNMPPWNYMGAETLSSSNNVDWVLVSFRTGTDAESEIAQTAGLLQRDGCIYFPNENVLPSNLTVPVYIVVEHRNHLVAMTPQAVDVVNNTLTYDFRTANSYGTSSSYGQKQLPTGEWCLYAGDISSGSLKSYDINGADKATWLTSNGLFDDYLPADLNLNGDVNGNDKAVWLSNNGVFSSVPK